MPLDLAWVILTQGTRPDEVAAAIASIERHGRADQIVVVENGGSAGEYGAGVDVVRSESNVGIPGGRDLGVRATSAAVVAFLDDDAELLTAGLGDALVALMASDELIGAVALRIVDEDGVSQRRHVPRPGSRSADRSGPVATFLGGACAIRRSAYDAAGGYWERLFYAHEELELSWRLVDAGNTIWYASDLRVRHPRLPISRHAAGWELTGRNRVLVARRDLPWPLVLIHTAVWLAIGAVRAPGRAMTSAYARGWRDGWRADVDRRPIAWRTVARLTRLGRPPVV